MALDVAHLQQWLGKTEQQHDNLTLFPMEALAATLDRGNADFKKGSALPPLWHWMYFLTPAPRSQLAHDGHPKKVISCRLCRYRAECGQAVASNSVCL